MRIARPRRGRVPHVSRRLKEHLLEPSSSIRAYVVITTLILCLYDPFLVPKAHADEQNRSLSDPLSPLPPNATGNVTAWTTDVTDLIRGIADMKGEIRSLQTEVVNFKDALADLIGSIKGWELLEEKFYYLVRMESDLLFDFDSAAIRPDARSDLDRFARVLSTYERKELTITGHTDSKGTDQYNEKLSLRRANAVMEFLKRSGILHAWRFSVKGKGEREPVAANESHDGRDDPLGRQKNRRVEIRIPKLKT